MHLRQTNGFTRTLSHVLFDRILRLRLGGEGFLRVSHLKDHVLSHWLYNWDACGSDHRFWRKLCTHGDVRGTWTWHAYALQATHDQHGLEVHTSV